MAHQKKMSARRVGMPVLIRVICILCIFPCVVFSGNPFIVSLASYNVENLFDLKKDLTEYPGYIPDGEAGWNSDMLNAKLAHMARVINDLDADILALQEIESKQALSLLNQRLKTPYPYTVIADSKPTTVKCALMSRLPIKSAAEIVIPQSAARNILKVEIAIADSPFTVFVNHWKSKTGPESRRLPYARALAGEIEKLGEKTDFVIVGDLNTNYNEFKTFRNNPELNDTSGVTGINHLLNTVYKDRLVTERILNNQPENGIYLYNLWLELRPDRRWSVQFFTQKNSPDHIIVSPGLYDEKGISYVDNSFDKFDPNYLFHGARIQRWQRAENGRGRHLGAGFSDHLPVFAWFAPRPFSYRPDAPYPQKTVPVAALYAAKTGRVNYHLRHCTVIYQHRKFTIIKQRNGRAILVYGADDAKLIKGQRYHLTVKYMTRYCGMLEITEFSDVDPTGEVEDLTPFFVDPAGESLSDPTLVNEVVSQVKGLYRDGWLHYGRNRRIRLYSRDKDLLPKTGSRIRLRNIRIGFHHHPELVLESARQLEVIRGG